MTKHYFVVWRLTGEYLREDGNLDSDILNAKRFAAREDAERSAYELLRAISPTVQLKTEVQVVTVETEVRETARYILP